MELSRYEAAYKKLAEDSERWMSSAENLLSAARLLWLSVKTDLNSRSTPPPDGGDHADVTTNHGSSRPFLQHASVFLMLCGFAVENALKAVCVREQQDGVTKSAFGTVGISRPLLTHDLRGLATKAGITLSTAERELIERLEAYLVWAGRYPVATTARGQTSVQNIWTSDEAEVTKLIERIRSAYLAAGGRYEEPDLQ